MIHTTLNIQNLFSEILCTKTIDADTTAFTAEQDPDLTVALKLCLACSVSSNDLKGVTAEDLIAYMQLFKDFFDESVGNISFVFNLKSRFDKMAPVVKRRLL